MSYDILAFDPQATTDAAFATWWDEQSAWSEDHHYDDPAVTTPALRGFYREMIETFPSMNGPDAPTDEDIDANPDLQGRLVDYSIGRRVVYGAARWSQAEQFAQTWERVGRARGVAVAFVSDVPLRIVRP